MNISRKEFLCRGIYAFGRDLVDTLKVRESETVEAACLEDHGYLLLDNSRCLAQRGGCFACIDHCPKAAVSIALGTGIAIDGELCDGCGECAAVCPIDPKVITMKWSEANQIIERRHE
jgi:Dissimilatory sulfite reductase (desulfoviridin), alpha and beta subunits